MHYSFFLEMYGKKCLRAMLRSLLLISVLLFLIPMFSLAQFDRISEEDIQSEEKYIAAYSPTLYDGGDVQERKEKLIKIIEEDPMNDAAYYVLATLNYQEENFSMALDYAGRAYNIDRNNKWYAIFYADVFAQMGAHTEAAEIYSQLYGKYPQNRDFVTGYVQHLLSSGDAEKALEVALESESEYGFDPDLSLRKLMVLEKLKRKDDIVAEWGKLIDYDPANMNHRLNLAQFYLAEENWELLRSTLNDILVIDPENVRAQMALSQLQDNTETYSESELEKIIRDPSRSIDLKVNSLLPELINLKPDSVERNIRMVILAEELTQQYPQNAKAWSVLGDFYFNTGNAGAATQAFAQACKHTKSVYAVWEQYLNCLLYTADYKTLDLKADEALMYFPNQAYNYYLLAYANVMLNNKNAALMNLQQAQMMAGKNIMLLQNIAGMQAYIASTGDKDADVIVRAITSFNTARQVSPEAVLWLLKAVEKNKEIPDSRFRNLIEDKLPELTETMDKFYVKAVYNFLNNNMNEALELALKSYYMTGYTRPETALFIGEIQRKLGNEEKAEMWYNNSANQGYDKNIISQKLKELN